jgi:hypothetical protein
LNLSLFFLIVALGLVLGAALLLFAVVLRRGRGGANVFLAVFLIALAIGVWFTAIRSPLSVP